MKLQDREPEDTLAAPVNAVPAAVLVAQGPRESWLWPVVLSLALGSGVIAFAIATYPLYPRMYLSPVLDLYPALGDAFLRLYSTPAAHNAVDSTGGNIYFYLYATANVWLFAVYLAALRFARGVAARRRYLCWALASAALASLLFVFAPTLFTSDLYSYTIYGRIAAVYGSNPLVVPPNRFPFDPVFPLLYWKDTVSVYGPLWISLSSLLMSAIPPSVSLQVATFKIVAIVFHFANAVVIWHILRRLAPRRQVFGVVVYLWNPLLLVEFAGNGHNDVVMIFLILMSLLSIVQGHRLRPVAFLSAAILTKWIAVFLLPVYIVAVLREHDSWRKRARFLLSGTAVGSLVAALLYLPYWAGPATLTAMFNSAAVERFLNSPTELLVEPTWIWLREILPYPVNLGLTEKIAGQVLKGILGATFVAVWVFEIARAGRPREMAKAWLRVLFAYLIVACFWFWPWYVSWLVPFIALIEWNRLTKAALIFSFSGFLFYATWPGAPLRPFEPYYDLRSIALFGPPLLYLAASVLIQWRRALLESRRGALGEV